MKNFTLENFEPQINRQVVHMDQGVCYNPEYLATGAMRYYPSRVMQIARAVWLNQLPISEYGAKIVFSSILSGQGERWQNFGEDQNEYMLSMMLFRELFVKQGFGNEIAAELEDRVKRNEGHIIHVNEEEYDTWKKAIPVSESSTTRLFVDDATFAYTSSCAYHVGEFLKKHGLTVQPMYGPYFGGFEYFAEGLIDQGYEHLLALVQNLADNGVKTVITLSGQSQFLLTTLCEKLGIQHKLQVISILSVCDSLDVKSGYVYGGSFYTRYLRMDGEINKLTMASDEERVPNSWEFVPLLNGSRRQNVVTIWQAPLAPEFVPFGVDQAIMDAIYENGLDEIHRAGFKQLVVCDPFAYQALKEKNCTDHLVYYTSLLK